MQYLRLDREDQKYLKWRAEVDGDPVEVQITLDDGATWESGDFPVDYTDENDDTTSGWTSFLFAGPGVDSPDADALVLTARTTKGKSRVVDTPEIEAETFSIVCQ